MSAFFSWILSEILKPVVYKIGSDDADLSYKWEISGNDIIPFVLDSTMTLKAISCPWRLIESLHDYSYRDG